MIDNSLQLKAELDQLSNEKLYLGAIRSLLDDDRFQRYLAGMKRRFDATVHVMDAIPAEKAIELSEIKGVRNTYKHEIHIIETAKSRIIEIDGKLSMINKQNKTKAQGVAGQSRIVSPKEKK